MKLSLDLKTLVLIVSASLTLAGFYYTTESRLKAVELEVLDVQQQSGKLKEDIKRLNKLTRNLKKELGK